MRAVIVDLLCNAPFYDGALVRALRQNGVEAELASPLFYLESDYLEPFPRCRWVVDLTVHLSHPRAARLGTRAIEFPINLLRLIRAIRGSKYDVVHLQWIPLEDRETRFMRLLRSACARAGVPLVYTAHNVVPHDSPNANRDVIRRNLNLADLVIAHTDHVAQKLRDLLGVQTPVAIIPHGALFTDLELPPRERALAELRLGGGPMVLFAGSVKPYKGLDLLADAWPAIRAVFPDAVLIVAGQAASDEARDQLRRVSEMHGVLVTDGYVPMKTMLNFHAVSDVVVFPYRSISQSGALMTAVGLGRPSVVTPIPGFVEQAAAAGSIVISDGLSSAAIARTTIAALQNREALLAAAAEDRRRIARSPVGWLAVGRETARQYEWVLEDGSN